MSGDLRISAAAAERIRAEIERAGGREVCFLAEVGPGRELVEPRAVARGNHAAVVAAARDATQGGVMVHNHPSGTLEPSAADLTVASRLYQEGLGTAICDNRATRLYVVVEPPEPRRVEPLDVDALEAVVAPGGVLSRVHPTYEDREGQRQMLRLVAQRYNEGGVAVVEAGTGTGKSLAYLLPAVRWAARNGERTVISTNTINLQEQLVSQDLPIVDELEEAEVDWALVKGRGNYVSIRRARLALQSADSLFEDDRSEELQSILEWTRKSDDGSLTDLSFVPSDETWEEVRSDSDICLRARCPHFQECFYQRSRRRASSADVLIVNHHLLFTDLAVRRATDNYTDAAVLPAYRHLVLDEAHNVEDAATSHLGVEVTRTGMYRTLSRLDRRGKGILSAVQDRLSGRPDRGEARAHLRRIEERVRPALDDARSRVELFQEALRPLLPEAGQSERIGGEGIPEPVESTHVRERLEGLLAAFSHLKRQVEELRKRLELDDGWCEPLEGRLLDLGSVERRLASAARGLRLVLDPEDEDRRAFVRWLEHRRSGSRKRSNPALAAAPVELGPLLRASLFERADTVVLSSATLATRNRFDFIEERLGLAGNPGDDATGILADAESDVLADGRELTVVEAVVPSPFDFRSQTVLGVPTDLPPPRSGGGGHQDATARILEELAAVTGGGVFGLFTAHRTLRGVGDRLRNAGVEARHPLFVQGEASRARLLADFVSSGSGILLGTASFWEGVDVPGRPLRGLVIEKLPFRVPTEPVTAARLEAVEDEGGNPFWDYMLPLAALRLKQGFGRLIRSRTDRGAVLLLDDRILTRRYGRYLRDSLPETRLLKGPWPEVRRGLEAFYGS